jgi:long-chain acyl-CoA synthetase
MAPRRNLASLLDDLARDPDRAAFVLRTPYRSFRWTAGRTRATALAVASRLVTAGVRPSDRILLQGPSSPEWCAAFLGIAASGAVAVPVDAGASMRFLQGVARRVSARAALVDRAALAAVADVPSVMALDELASMPREGDEPAPHRAAPEETAEIVFTSGTTAEPRGVELSHANLLSSLERIEAGFLKRQWYLRPLLPFRILCAVPLSHLFGQSLGIFIPIVMRSTGIFPASLKPTGLLRTVRDERPLAVVAVPRTLAALRESVERELERRGRLERFERRRSRAAALRPLRRIVATRDLRAVLGWRTWALVVGGAPLDADLEDFWSDAGMAVIQGYGMTEAAPIVSIQNPLQGRRHTLGRPVGGIEVRLDDDGEVWVRGPNVMKGYFDDPDATREALRDGWLRTGDLGERDEAGRLYYRGRKKDVIVTPGGMNVFPSDVEGVLRSLPGVRDAVAFGLPGPGGEEVHAAVLPSRPSLDAERLRERANERLEPHQHLRRIVVWSAADFPRTATGKVRRGEVRQGEARRAESPRASTADARVARVFGRVRRDLASGTDPRERLSEPLDLDSLETLELLGLIEEEFGVAVDDRQVAASLTLGQVERIVAGPRAPRLRMEMPRWSRRFPARWVRAVLQRTLVPALLRLWVRFEIAGRGRVTEMDGACILVANHTSVFDAPAVLLALPAGLRGRLAPAMAIEVLPERLDPAAPLVRRLRSSLLYGLAVLIFNAYPLPQSRGFRPSLEYTGELLDAGLWPLIFPEGRMTRSGKMESFKQGIGLLALETRATIVPVHLEGLGRILPPRARWPKVGRARVTLGDPFDPLEGGIAEPAEIAGRIERAVARLATRQTG